MNQLKIVDLFCGMGNFRAGFEKAGDAVTVTVVEAIANKIISIWKESNGNA